MSAARRGNMRVLYLDNYRGFKNSLIPIEDVNFLVGENSTGKSSVLSLLYLLTHSRFWFEQTFNIEDVELGAFGDISSSSLTATNEIRIGMMDAAKGEKSISNFLLTFVNKNGVPVLKRYDYSLVDHEVNILIDKDAIKYRVLQHDNQPNRESRLQGLFNKWIKKEFPNPVDMKILDTEPSFLNKPSLAILNDFITSKLLREKKPKDYSSFYWGIRYPLTSMTWIGPIRSEPQRTYDAVWTRNTSAGAHIPYVIREILNDPKRASLLKNFLSEFGKESSLFDDISVEEYREKDPTAPFSLKIRIGKNVLNIKNVGYGISQSLPLIIEFFRANEGIYFAVQQPEIHLHPRAQAAFGDLILKLALEKNDKFLVETHSDYSIDRFRMSYGKSTVAQKPTAQVLYFERTLKRNRVFPIPILRNGEYSKRQPKNFRSFFIKEQLELLKLD